MARPDVTVVVPTRNEVHNIGRLLRSLPRWVPLIVVDGSSDGTADAVRALRPEARVLAATGGVASSRQAGAEAAETEWVLCTDADVVFAPDYFDRLPDRLDGDAFFGPKRSLGGYGLYHGLFCLGQAALSRLGIPAASTSNFGVRRAVLAAAGGFDVRLPCNEDTELAFRLAHRGYRVRWAPDLAVYNADHRRLRRGVAWKLAHSLTRSALIYYYVRRPPLPGWLYSDWGYWAPRPEGSEG